ncbi:hypothetical protein [Alcanivorax sp. 1008]|uniref:hypothetical protein n=1 Tax=Alcanivorax sp. 1008 TaxID=2816853 RepID=UPI001D3FFA97|nr:hypothetical protein [Alcanivorax sp. 1008]MCC1496741.1 hypothetical protein [Alcanivorax sp. 1008]
MAARPLQNWIASIEALSPAVQVAISMAADPAGIKNAMTEIVGAATSALPAPGPHTGPIASAVFSTLVKSSALQARAGADPRQATSAMAAGIAAVVAAEGLPAISSRRKLPLNTKDVDLLATEDALAEATADVALTLQRRGDPLAGLEEACGHIVNLAISATETLGQTAGNQTATCSDKERLNSMLRLSSKIYCASLIREQVSCESALTKAFTTSQALLPIVVSQVVQTTAMLAAYSAQSPQRKAECDGALDIAKDPSTEQSAIFSPPGLGPMP